MDPITDPGAIASAAGATLHHVAGLSPGAQIAAVIMLGLALLAVVAKPYVVLFRGAAADADTIKLMIAAIGEQATATREVAEQVERLAETVVAGQRKAG